MPAPDAAGRPGQPHAPLLPEAADHPWPDPDLDPEYPDLDSIELTGHTIELPSARTLSILRCQLTDCDLEVEDSVPVDIQDSVLTGVDLTGRRITNLLRVRLERCRLGGSDLSEAEVRDVVISDCVLDLSAWRSARVERTRVVGGRVDGMDLSGAELHEVTISGVSLNDVTWDRVRAERVDLTAADLSAIRDVRGLRGCTISPSQAVLLAARSAQALGIRVRADE